VVNSEPIVDHAANSWYIPLRVPMLGSEKAIELNYAAYLKPYLMCQPVFQYYWDVGGNSRVPDPAVMGFRVIIDF